MRWFAFLVLLFAAAGGLVAGPGDQGFGEAAGARFSPARDAAGASLAGDGQTSPGMWRADPSGGSQPWRSAAETDTCYDHNRYFGCDGQEQAVVPGTPVRIILFGNRMSHKHVRETPDKPPPALLRMLRSQFG